MILIALAVFVPAAIYVVLSTDWAIEKIKVVGEQELTQLLGTNVSLGSIHVQPFNKINISNTTIEDDFGQEALSVSGIEARFEFWYFVTTGRIVFDYVALDGVNANLYKRTKGSPLNIAGIIERLKSKEPGEQPARFDLAIYTVKLTDATVSYNVLDAPLTNNKFDVNHISVSDLDLYVTAPKLSNEEISGRIRHLSFTDRSGLRVDNIIATAKYTPKQLTVNDLCIDLSGSHFNFGDYTLKYKKPDDIVKVFRNYPIGLHLDKGSYFTLSDLGCFVPVLKGIKRRFNINFDLIASQSRFDVKSLNISEVTDGGFLLEMAALIDKPLNKDSLTVKNLDIDVSLYPASVIDVLNRAGKGIPVTTSAMLGRLGRVSLKANAAGSMKHLEGSADISTSLGNVLISGDINSNDKFKTYDAQAAVSVDDFDVGTLLDNPHFGRISTQLEGTIYTFLNRRPIVDVTVSNTSAEFNGHLVDTLDGSFNLDESGKFEGRLEADIDKASVLASFNGETRKTRPSLAGVITVSHFNPNSLGLISQYPGYELDADLRFDLAGDKGKWIDGYADIANLKFRSRDASQPSLTIDHFNITANNTVRPNIIEVTSDFLNGSFQGDVSLLNLVQQTKDVLATVIPALVGRPSVGPVMDGLRDNDFRFNLVLDNAENLLNFFKIPVEVIYPVTIDGRVSKQANELLLGVDAPYLMKGDMIIEQTTVQARFDGNSGEGNLYLTTQFPTKKGEMTIVGGIQAKENGLSTEINWEIERDKPINGDLKFDTRLMRDVDNGQLAVSVDFLPCEVRFGNDQWAFAPSTITYKPGYLDVDNFALKTQTQSILIDGTCSKVEPDSEVLIHLDNVVLNTIFETLDINKALIGGVATGTLHAGGIFSREPFVTCDNLHVKNIGYNNCVLGDGDIKTHWDNDRKSFYIDAVISQEEGRKSYIRGDIMPASESLDISFDADKVKVGFMKPFMDAFAADITGFASGHARIFGTFKYIDMEGDVFAEDLGLKVDFTNTWYYATDSIHLTPGLIDVKNVTVRDVDGNTAKLNGIVKHTFFKDPVFDFRVTDAENFLSYDVTPSLSPDWYGKIYGNGSAFITGSPGVVNIDVNMSTAEGSVFTFVLSDQEEAEQYNFITFRDKNRNVITDSIIQKEILPEAVIAFRDRARMRMLAQNPPLAYNMNIQVDITPAAKIVLVMDPVGGDEIKSWGKGNLRMTYASIGNELRMYGSYIIDRGSYNFTLQDIIVKDFTIKEGSSITFTGDPYNAALDIAANYSVNANLSDLDESFLNDPELNRTNVPVRALLLVRGDMRQPDIDFDLEFPTLTSDVYRKVRSIISTDEMMNRQIIYLLALNRFYTPEYMSATKGNELFSVASSTISSRLSSMLGKLSENWTIAPNLRSDRGDFSDVQFDVALSSNLLNNRLRMNGNFGYRDKSLNTSQFIGDFDLEYLINRTGSWRLKAYNRFNDQTYFLRTAKTTQGVGIMFRRDFDNMFNFLRPKKHKSESKGEPADSLKQETKGSIVF